MWSLAAHPIRGLHGSISIDVAVGRIYLTIDEWLHTNASVVIARISSLALAFSYVWIKVIICCIVN